MQSERSIIDESQLWNKLKAGDKNALATVYNLHARALYNYGNRMFQNAALVEDSIHDLFADLWNSRKNLGSVIAIRAYLYASLRRKIVKITMASNTLGYDSRWEELHLLAESEEEKIIQKELHDEQTAKLRSHLNNLSPRQYEAIVLRYYDKLSYSDIAQVMDVNEQSVRNFIQRGLENLRQYARLTITLLVPMQWLLLF